MSVFRQGHAVRNAHQVKTWSAIACAVLPPFLTAYSGLAANHQLLNRAEDMGVIVAFLIGAIGAVSTVITSPLVGLAPTGKRFYERGE